MSRRNPYRVTERLVEKAGNALLALLCIASVALVLFLMGSWLWEDAGWGWWSLTIIVIAPLGLALIGLLVALLRGLVEVIDNRWRQAKFRWDDSRTQVD